MHIFLRSSSLILFKSFIKAAVFLLVWVVPWAVEI